MAAAAILSGGAVSAPKIRLQSGVNNSSDNNSLEGTKSSLRGTTATSGVRTRLQFRSASAFESQYAAARWDWNWSTAGLDANTSLSALPASLMPFTGDTTLCSLVLTCSGNGGEVSSLTRLAPET